MRLLDPQARDAVAERVDPFGQRLRNGISEDTEALNFLTVAGTGGKSQHPGCELDDRAVAISREMRDLVDHSNPVIFSARP